MNTKDIVMGERIFALFKGENGTGKTVAAGSFPDPYFFFFEDRMAPLRLFYPGKDIEYDLYDNLYAFQNKLDEFQVKCPYKTLCVSTITSLVGVIMKSAAETRGSSSKRIMKGTMELAQMEDYKYEVVVIEAILDALKSLSVQHNIHVIVEAHVLTVSSVDMKTKVTNVSRSIVTVGNKPPVIIPTKFNETYHFDVDTTFGPANEPSTVRYIARTQHTGADWAKTALPLPPVIDFTKKSFYDEIMKYVRPANNLVQL